MTSNSMGSPLHDQIFEPFFNQENLPELRGFKGDFTRRVLLCFDDITCIEVSAIVYRWAYSLDASERDALAERLKMMHRSGIFLTREGGGQMKVLFVAIAQMLELEKTLLEVDTCP